MSNIGSIAKALIAFLTAGGGAYTVALQDGVATQGEIVNVVILALVAGLAVYATPNQDAQPYDYSGHVEPLSFDTSETP